MTSRPVLHRVLVLFLAVVPGFAGAGETIRTQGRRVAVGTGDVLTLTEPDLNRVVIFDISGEAPQKRLAFGDPGLSLGQLKGPHGAVLDGQDLFVADTFNHRIQVFRIGVDTSQPPRLVRAWGDFGRAVGELRAPHAGLALFKDRVFVPDTRNDRVQPFRRTGEPDGPVMGGPGAEEGKLDNPVAVAFDPSGLILYIAELGNRRVSAFDPRDGSFVFAFGGPQGEPFAPAGLAVSETGELFVTDIASRKVRRYRPQRGPDGRPRGVSPSGAWGRAGTGPGEWTYPQSITIDRRQRVYVCDQATKRCQFFTADGRLLGAFGDDLKETPFSEPPPQQGALPSSFCSNGGSYGVELVGPALHVPLNEHFKLELKLRGGCAEPRPVGVDRVLVDAVMPAHRHGMNTRARVTPLGGDRYAVDGLLLHMSGHWELHVNISRGGVTERAQVDTWLD